MSTGEIVLLSNRWLVVKSSNHCRHIFYSGVTLSQFCFSLKCLLAISHLASSYWFPSALYFNEISFYCCHQVATIVQFCTIKVQKMKDLQVRFSQKGTKRNSQSHSKNLKLTFFHDTSIKMHNGHLLRFKQNFKLLSILSLTAPSRCTCKIDNSFCN